MNEQRYAWEFITPMTDHYLLRMTEAAATILVQDARAMGDHDFQGLALDAWQNQRAAISAGLNAIRDQRLISYSEASRYTTLPCPQTFPGGEGAGTREGSRWVNEATDFILFWRNASEQMLLAEKKQVVEDRRAEDELNESLTREAEAEAPTT